MAAVEAADVGQVVLHELGAERRQVAGLGGVADERDDVVAAVAQPLDDGPPDEPGAAGDDDAHQEGPASLGIG